MVIKLRKFSRSRILKFLSFSLAVVLISLTLLQMIYVYSHDLNPETIFVKEYLQSEAFRYGELSRAIHNVNKQIDNNSTKITPEPEYLYYITDGNSIKHNAYLADILEHEKYLYKYSDQVWEYGENTYKNIQNYLDEKYTLYLVFPEEYMEQKQYEWEAERARLLPLVIYIIISIVVALICIFYLFAVTGRKPEDDEVHLSPYMDRIYSDIGFWIMFLTLVLWAAGVSDLSRQFGFYQNSDILSMNQIVIMMFIAFVTGITSIICGVILLSFVRKIKARKLLKHSMLYAILVGISKFIRSFYDDSRFEHFPLTKSLNRRQTIFTVSSGFMVFLTLVFVQGTVILGLIPVWIEIIIIYWYFYENRKTYDEINQGFHSSLQEQMKSERMKVDLITNVSHDLKTPLTSIISYVDLLSKEELSESASDYVNILADKSERLKNIVSDLFDLAKSSSGNLALNMENLDLKKLIEQTLGDMGDEIEKVEIRIKASLLEEPVYIYSDGKKIYRVFQNVLGNTLKYSLPGTRVFIDMEIDNNYVNVTVKNTASYDMDFTAEDVLQRFNRGDKARTTEGSGLGLSIAESFTLACGGRFQVEIDGDQFKVKLGFPMMIVE